jgi:FtsP/CotA-like multicopper oxidase with cupredoxin domain
MRRRRARLLCLALALLGTTALGPAQPSAHPYTGFDPIDVGGLPEIRAQNGVLETTLVASPQTITLGDARFPGASFNGAYGGPVLRLHAGDLLRIHLINHMPDAINLHFHGLRVSPLAHGDNMHILVAPGGNFTYELRIPRNHPAGLFWYHDHAHHAAERHVMAGLSGALLIEGFAQQFRTLADIPQELLVLKDWTQPGCMDAALRQRFHCHAVSINGQAAWAVKMQPNETQLWRISNQSANLIIHLALPGLHLRAIGQDGVPTTASLDLPTLDVLPASRLDVLVRADTPGLIPLLATHVPTTTNTGFTTSRPLGSVTVAGPLASTAAEPEFPNTLDLRPFRPNAHRRIAFDENAAATIFTINGRIFDAKRIDLRVPLGNIEEWTILNTTNDFHEFHIHQLGFQVTEINGVAQDFSGYVDDVKVPEMGSVKLLIPFTDPNIVGHFMFHCHVLKHEDNGMMANIEVYLPGAGKICRVPPT